MENPPLLIVSDMARFRIRNNWTNSVSVTHEFTFDDLSDGATRDKLKWAMSDPERLRPGETRQAVTERTAATFAELAQDLRDRGHDPQTVAHFVNLTGTSSQRELLCWRNLEQPAEARTLGEPQWINHRRPVQSRWVPGCPDAYTCPAERPGAVMTSCCIPRSFVTDFSVCS